MRKITIFTFLLALSGISTLAQTARVQLIHNSADAAASVVDVYVNGTILMDDLEFRTATPFMDAPAGVPLEIAVAPGNSTSAADEIYTTTTTLTANGTYIAVASGIVSTTGYTPNQPFNLYIYDMARESAETAGNIDVLVFHGATDAPTVDAVEPGTGVVVNDISYGEFQGYLELENDDYMINITTANNSNVIQGYYMPLDLLNLDGEAITVLASGFFLPENNSNGPGFGMWIALPEGGDLIQLPLSNDMARVQLIHNSADLAASTVDIYINEDIFIDDFQFRTATAFMDVPAGIALDVAIAPGNSTSADESIYNETIAFNDEFTYIVVANGIVSTTGYTPNQPFDLHIYPTAREAATMAANTDILVFHGATDAPEADINVQGEGVLFNDVSYGEFDGYESLLAEDYIMSITSADGSMIFETYSAPLETLSLAGEAITILASGFVNPGSNSNGPEFGLWAALPEGGELIELPLGELGIEENTLSKVTVYPNPATDVVHIALPEGYSKIESTVYDIAGRNVLTTSGTLLDISGLNNGVYMANITVDGVTITKKIIKE